MIKLYREKNSMQADTIEAEFRELVLGYDRVIVEPKDAVPTFGAEISLPVLTDNARVISGGHLGHPLVGDHERDVLPRIPCPREIVELRIRREMSDRLIVAAIAAA